MLQCIQVAVSAAKKRENPRKIGILPKWNTAAFYESVNEDHYEGIIGVSLERCNF